MKVVRGKPPVISRDLLVEIILKYKNEIVFENQIARATANIWKTIEEEIDHKIKATSLHSMCVGNRYGLKSLLTNIPTNMLTDLETIEEEMGRSDDSVSSHETDKHIFLNFILTMKTTKFDSLLTERVYSTKTKNGKKKHRRVTIFQPKKWTEIVSKKMFDDYRLHHGFHFKNHYLTRRADYGVFQGEIIFHIYRVLQKNVD